MAIPVPGKGIRSMTSKTARPSARRRLGIGAVLAAGSLAAAGLAFAPAAAAVVPTSATVTFNCGLYGGGAATLTTVQTGTSATITVTSAIAAPLPSPPTRSAPR